MRTFVHDFAKVIFGIGEDVGHRALDEVWIPFSHLIGAATIMKSDERL